MLIGNNWKIESASLNVVLSKNFRRKNKKTGKMYTDWEIMGYFSSVEHALHELINQGVRDTELKDLKTIIPLINRLHQIIEDAIRKPTVGDRAVINKK